MKNKFKVIVNPFLMEATIKKGNEVLVMNYTSLDEWNSFKIDDNEFDIHFHYENEFTVNIYEVIEGSVNYDKIKMKLKIELKD